MNKFLLIALLSALISPAIALATPVTAQAAGKAGMRAIFPLKNAQLPTVKGICGR